jgi:hypothetical protein
MLQISLLVKDDLAAQVMMVLQAWVACWGHPAHSMLPSRHCFLAVLLPQKGASALQELTLLELAQLLLQLLPQRCSALFLNLLLPHPAHQAAVLQPLQMRLMTWPEVCQLHQNPPWQWQLPNQERRQVQEVHQYQPVSAP